MGCKVLGARFWVLGMVLVSLTACGIKGNLVRPSDIPKIEAEKAKKEHRSDGHTAD